MEVSAIFDSEDTAQLALSRLREAGIKVQSVRFQSTSGYDEGTGTIPSYISASNAVGPAMVGWGLPFIWPNVSTNTGAETEREITQEVLLSVQVPPQDARQTESLLINASGRQVRSH